MKKTINYKKIIREIGIIFLGNLLLAISASFFFINYSGIHIYNLDNGQIKAIEFHGVLVGGTSGFALILRNLFFINVTDPMIVETIVTITTWILFFLGLIFLGKRFAIQTLLGTILYPIFIYLFKLPIFDVVHQQINLFDPIVCAIIGGLGMGTGCGIIYRIGGSTGGFDIPGLIINKFTRIKLSTIFLFMDGLLVLLAFIAKFTLYEIVVGLISVIAYSLGVEVSQKVGTEAYFCDIISEKWEEINKEILALDRGTTIVDVTGGYTDKPRKMIKTMVGKNQYLAILDIVKKIDPNAFMSMTMTHNVFGEGYKDIREFSNK